MLTDPRQLPEAYAAAVYERDVAAFAALYAPDAHAFDTWDAAPMSGPTAFREMAAEWFGSLGEERVKVTFQEISTSVGETVAALHGFITFQALGADGQPLRASRERMSWVLERRGLAGREDWLVVHQHTSAFPRLNGTD